MPYIKHSLLTFLSISFLFILSADISNAGISPTRLRCEYRKNPLGVDSKKPRLSWRVESKERGQKQIAYQILVASTQQQLDDCKGDLWDSGKVNSAQTLFVEYSGKPLTSRTLCYWKVKVWGVGDEKPTSSQSAFWQMGLLNNSDWTADYISFKDNTPVHKDVKTLHLPAARHYRKEFDSSKTVKQATVFATALGIYELEINGKRIGDAYFAPGWTDYRQRAYYNTYDVTENLKTGENAFGAIVADGWYSGYVGFGLLTGMGTEKNGRDTYGKTPSLMAQLEIEYTDGTRKVINTNSSWKVTDQGPIQEADLLMGEAYDARKELTGWSSAGYDDSQWQNAIWAKDNGKIKAMFYEGQNPTEPGRGPKITGTLRDLGFNRPKLEAFPGVPVRIIEELPAKKVTKREEGIFSFDLGQNFAGVIRMKVKGPKGHRITIRYGEMLHPDGRLMTENLRKARATDYYICKGDPNGEIYEPRFTFHGFQFVEVSNFPGKANLETITGLVMHSDTPMTSEFTCSDPMVNQLFKNVVWTQRANFLDLPTDCPQRDERMGWTGDAQAYVATAAYNADIGAFYTKWLRELMESQRPSGAFPGYSPFPFQHGWDFGSAWADAGVICPWTIWQAYGDLRVIKDCWEPMTKFMDWRKRTSKNDLGISHGNAWGDWLAQGASTPLDYVDTVYYAISSKMMAEMADAIGHKNEAKKYRAQFERTRTAFIKKYMNEDGSINVRTQTAQALALFADLVPDDKREGTAKYLAAMIQDQGNHMSTGFLGTRPLLPVLSSAGQHDLATFLLQSREFPSWGYEIANGATTIWERWDSYTKEDAFGRHNAAMNSFSHYAFGAVCEWMFRTLAGIDSDGPGYKTIIINPNPPSPNSNAMHEPIDWVRASYDSIRGPIVSDWKIENGKFHLNVSIPANTTAKIYIPTTEKNSISESGKSLQESSFVKFVKTEGNRTVLAVESGDYQFVATSSLKPASKQLKTSKPKDNSLNPFEVDLTNAKKVAHWDFSKMSDIKKWNERNNTNIISKNGKTYLIATGQDPQIATSIGEDLSGKLVIELRVYPAKAVESQFFWANPRRGFNGSQQSKRRLNPTEQINSYLFPIEPSTPIRKLRFDPFATYDKYAKQGEMQIESISIYNLSPQKKNRKSEHQTSRKTSGNKKNFPNILFILSEDQGAHLSLLNTPGLKTPHIDALAKQGTYFKNAFVAYPVCSPSKAALYTGLYGHTNGIMNNTYNYHKPANKVTAEEHNRPLAKKNRVKDQYFTLTEILKANGYYQGVTHKLHVLPNKKFPYDEFLHGGKGDIRAFLNRTKSNGAPWFLMVNIPNSHRPYPNSDKEKIRVNPDEVEIPKYLPDTPIVRKDWSEYLAGIEEVDTLVGETMQELENSGQDKNTIVIYMSDHGPTFQHGKMTLYDLGLRVPLIFKGPSIPSGKVSNSLINEIDLLPTILDLVKNRSGHQPIVSSKKSSKNFPYPLHGKSFIKILEGDLNAKISNYIFAEISNRGPLPNDGMQERVIFDGRWKLIYREKVNRAWRQVNADSREFKIWGNRTYAETIRHKGRFPKQYQILAEMDPQMLKGKVPRFEFYDLKNDPDEMNNAINKPVHRRKVLELKSALRNWIIKTRDSSMTLK